MFDRLPPLQTLRAFEATARWLSMSLAAEELHVTHGAVSRHIKTLENHLGVQLFQRLTRKIVLTEAGAEFHVAIAKLLGELTSEAERLRGQNTAKRLRISTGVSFATKWLAPRLHMLRAEYPDFDIHLDVNDTTIDLNSGQIDIAILYGKSGYRNVIAERILEETVTPVCSPAYLSGIGGLEVPADLAKCALLHEEPMLADWKQWLAHAGVKNVRADRGQIYSHGSMSIEAAIRGEGVTLGRSALIADDIAAGRLVAPFEKIRLKAGKDYYLAYRAGSQNTGKTRAVRDWLVEEISLFSAG